MFGWYHIILLPIFHQANGVFSVIAEPPSLILEALDCKTNKVSYSRADEFCSKSQGNEVHRPLQRITLAEHVEKQTVKAIRCTKTVSSSTHMCGAYSHMKLAMPPKYTVATEISPHECKTMHDTGIHRDGETYPITVNTVLQYQKVAKGKLTLTEDNVYCNGEQSWIQGLLHSQIMVFEDVVISMQEVTLEINFQSRTAADVTNRRELDESCFISKMCLSSNESYVKLEEVNMCRVKRVKSLKVEEHTVNTDKGQSNLVVSHEDKIAIEKRSPLVPSLECERQVGKYYATNIDDLLIVYDRDLGKEKLERLTAEGVSVRAEEIATSTYLSLTSVLKTEGMSILTNDRLCRTIANAIDTTEMSPFTTNAILKRKGDLIVQIQCKQTEVSVTLGESVETRCLEGYLSVNYNGKRALISSGSHILYDETDLTTFPSIDCSKAPYFVTKDGRVIQQRPKVEVVNITLTKLGAFIDDLTTNKIDQVDVFTNEGLYTSEQFHEFEDLIHWGRKRAMLQNVMIDNFCKDSDCLGTDRYNIDKNGMGPVSLVKSVMDWMRTTFWENLQIVGSYTSVVVVFLYACQLIGFMYRKMQNLLHLRLRLRTGRHQDKSSSRLHLNVESQHNHAFTQVQSALPEIMVMSELSAGQSDSQECECQYCRGVRHDAKLYWPRNTCGFSCCKYHLKGRCEPFEWCLLDPLNLAFDHREEDQKYKKSIATAISLRSVCRCNQCLGKFTHPGFKYFSKEACGCLRCENCNSAEVEKRKQLGIEYDTIFGRNRNRVEGNLCLE